MSAATETKKPRQPLNGVDVPTLFATISAVAGRPELAKFQFRAANRWQLGTHSRTTFETFSGAGGEQKHAKAFTYDADHPAVLVGRDQAPTPVEFLLHGLAGVAGEVLPCHVPSLPARDVAGQRLGDGAAESVVPQVEQRLACARQG